MKTLFNKDHKYLFPANEIDDGVSKFLQSVFKTYMAEGYSPREISHIIILAVLSIEMEKVLSNE